LLQNGYVAIEILDAIDRPDEKSGKRLFPSEDYHLPIPHDPKPINYREKILVAGNENSLVVIIRED